MEFRTIPADELDLYVGSDAVRIIDLRSREAYRRKHIRGALNYPYEERNSGAELPLEKELILYCERGALSMAVARELAGKNYRVKTVAGGIRAYRGRYLEKGS